jgi:hypothetical protein
VHRCQASGIRALQQGALSFSCSLPSTVPVLYRSQCCAVCRCAVQSKAHQVRHASTTAGGCRLFTARWAPCKGFCSTTLPERTHFTSWSRPSLHLGCLQGTASQWWALLLPHSLLRAGRLRPGLSHASLRRRRVCVLRAGVGRVPANLATLIQDGTLLKARYASSRASTCAPDPQ